MVDVGTMPDREGFLLLYERMRYNPEVGGCCGEIRVRNPAKNFWTMAQQFEYIVANQLDKGMSFFSLHCIFSKRNLIGATCSHEAVESLLGYVTVLPGAFSAYRYDAIKVGMIWC